MVCSLKPLTLLEFASPDGLVKQHLFLFRHFRMRIQADIDRTDSYCSVQKFRVQEKFLSSVFLPRSCLIAAIAALVLCSYSSEIEGFIPALTTIKQPLHSASIEGRCGIGRRSVVDASQFGSRSLSVRLRGLIALRVGPESAVVDENRTDDKFSVKIVGACVIRDGSILMVERRQRSRGYWEFPGKHPFSVLICSYSSSTEY